MSNEREIKDMVVREKKKDKRKRYNVQTWQEVRCVREFM